MTPKAEPVPGSDGPVTRVSGFATLGGFGPNRAARVWTVLKKSRVTRVPAGAPTLEPAGSVTPTRLKETCGAFRPRVGAPPSQTSRMSRLRLGPAQIEASTAGAEKARRPLKLKVLSRVAA